MTRVQLNDVTKRYGSTVAVDGVSADIADGEFVTLLGPSGCGKTTTLRMVAGLVEPTAGQIRFDGQVMNNVPSHKRNIGLAFQSHALFPHLSVARNIAFGLEVKGKPKQEIQQRVREMLDMIELSQHADRMPSQLSGGQQQRVALARMLATDPRVLLFDEPLSALDRNLRDTLKYSILDLQRRTGKTAIYVTHDQSEAFAISDRIVVMNGGRAEQIGTQTDIYLHPLTPFVAEFIGANNGLPGTVTAVEGSGEAARTIVSASGVTIRARPAAGVGVGDAVHVYLRPENIDVIDGSDGAQYENVVEGKVERVIFEGPTAQLRVDVGGRELRVDISGGQRLTLLEGRGKVRLGFDEVTLIPSGAGDDRAPAAAAASGAE